MGAGGQQSSSSSFGMSLESKLSRTQAKIVQKRQEQYEQEFFPQIVKGLAETDINSDASKAKMGLQTNAINTAFTQAEKATNQNLAQQGLANDSGVTASLQAMNKRNKASALATAYGNTLADNQQQKQNFLSIAAGVSPQPTTSAQYHQVNASQSSGSSWNAGI